MADGEQVIEDYRTLRLSLRAHPPSFLRERVSARVLYFAFVRNWFPELFLLRRRDFSTLLQFLRKTRRVEFLSA